MFLAPQAARPALHCVTAFCLLGSYAEKVLPLGLQGIVSINFQFFCFFISGICRCPKSER